MQKGAPRWETMAAYKRKQAPMTPNNQYEEFNEVAARLGGIHTGCSDVVGVQELLCFAVGVAGR